MSKKYRPSSGSGGCAFEEVFCDRCYHDEMEFDQNGIPTGNYIRQYDIHDRALLHDIKDPEYPSEWIYKEDTGCLVPVCTAFLDKNDVKKENPEPSNPDQLTFI